MVRLPDDTSQKRGSRLMIVVLPAPVGPTMAGTRALVELDATTGAPIHFYEGLNSDSPDTSAAPVAAENVVIATGHDLVALDTRTHRPRWTVPGDATAWFKSITMPAVAGHEVYALRGQALVAYLSLIHI